MANHRPARFSTEAQRRKQALVNERQDRKR
jgi:hypothetical protein